MEINKIPKDFINNIPSNLFIDPKSRKQLKIFYFELIKLIKEKAKHNQNLVNIKKDIYLLIQSIFKDKSQYFYYNNNFQSLEVVIFCLCNQIEIKASKIVEGYQTFDSNFAIDDKSKNSMQSFLISFYDFLK